MNCPRCGTEQPASSDGAAPLECVRCGIVFARLAQSRLPPRPRRRTDSPVPEAGGASAGRRWPGLRDLVLPPTGPAMPAVLAVKAAVLAGLAAWAASMVVHPPGSPEAPSAFLHLVNLPFHEAGHVVFRLFGPWMCSLGGSLGQVIMPLVCLFALLLQTRDAWGASVCLWWTGESLLDMAPYIDDARSLSLPLLGGNTGEDAPYGFHDWQFILTEIGCAHWDHALARVAHWGGAALMALGIAWGALVLWRQSRS